MITNYFILAQAEESSEGIEATKVTEQETIPMTAADGNTPAVQPRSKGGPSTLILFGLMAVVMYFMLFRGPRKKQQQHKQMVQKLKKNDKVRTIGGIIGTIVEVKDDEITLKVDESNNTKIKIATSAIGKNMSLENN